MFCFSSITSPGSAREMSWRLVLMSEDRRLPHRMARANTVCRKKLLVSRPRKIETFPSLKQPHHQRFEEEPRSFWSCFFFSSKKRHTICYRDWSSDVCSSDLVNTLRCVI